MFDEWFDHVPGMGTRHPIRLVVYEIILCSRSGDFSQCQSQLPVIILKIHLESIHGCNISKKASMAS